MTNTMRYLSRILTIALLTVVMPSFAQQEFVFKNMIFEDDTELGDIKVISNNGKITIMAIANNGEKIEFITAPYKYKDEKFLIEKSSDLYEHAVNKFLIAPLTMLFTIIVDGKPKVVILLPTNKDAYTREFNRMKQVLLGGSSVQNSTNITASVEKVWVDYDVFEYGKKGMRIHVKFHINGMLNKTGSVNAYFYLNNGNPLKDHNDLFSTTNGCVAAWEDFTPGYERCTYHDLTIFMPYSELELSQSAKCYFVVEIHDNNGQYRAISDKVYFDFNR